MPCVCLKNTFARWQSLKALAPAPVNSKLINPTANQPAAEVSSEAPSDASFLKVPHPKAAPNLSTPAATPKAPRRYRPSVRMTRADLINAESKLGSTIFGPIPAGHRREFFHDQKNIWIWHEDWYDGQHNPHQMTVRYEVRTSGVYKKIATGKYIKLEDEELNNFRKATHAYLYVIKKNLYNRPATAE